MVQVSQNWRISASVYPVPAKCRLRRYRRWRETVTLKGDNIAQEFQAIVEDYVQRNYAEGGKLRINATQKSIPIQAVN